MIQGGRIKSLMGSQPSAEGKVKGEVNRTWLEFAKTSFVKYTKERIRSDIPSGALEEEKPTITNESARNKCSKPIKRRYSPNR